jgi:drug/metabolite transporter (DMT)-like permease
VSGAAAGGVDRVGVACAAATALTWGLAGPLVRAIPALTPLEVAAGRLAFALAAVLPALALARGRAEAAHAARSRTAWALAALLAAYYLLAVAAFRAAPVADVALLLATAPLCALALRRLDGERATGRERTGALLALAGVAVTLVPSIRAAMAPGGAVAPAGGVGPGTSAVLRLAGDVLALLAALASAAYARRFQRAHAAGRAPTPLGVAVLTFALGASVLALRAGALGAPVVPLARLDARGMLLLALLGILSTLVPTLSFATAAQRLPPVLTSAAQLLVPLVSATAAALALGELPSVWLLPGGALVAVGLVRLLGATPPTPPAGE